MEGKRQLYSDVVCFRIQQLEEEEKGEEFIASCSAHNIKLSPKI